MFVTSLSTLPNQLCSDANNYQFKQNFQYVRLSLPSAFTNVLIGGQQKEAGRNAGASAVNKLFENK